MCLIAADIVPEKRYIIEYYDLVTEHNIQLFLFNNLAIPMQYNAILTFIHALN